MAQSVIPDTSLAPISDSKRIVALDIIRALALFGVLWMNMRLFSGDYALAISGHPVGGGLLDTWVKGIGKVFVAGKAMSCFSMLFGIGLFIQFERAEAKGIPVARFAFRRLGSLFLFGCAHWILLWEGDILTSYALTGTALLLFRHARAKTFLLGALAAYLLSGAWLPLVEAWHIPLLNCIGRMDASTGTMTALYGNGTWFSGVIWRLSTWGQFYSVSWFLNDIPTLLPLFLIGALCWRDGIVRNPEEHRPLLRKAFHGTFWIGMALAVLNYPPFHLVPKPWTKVWLGIPWSYVAGASMYLPALGFMSGLLLLLTKERWKSCLGFLGPMGRMALTNYLSQTLVWTWVFYHYGLGFWGKVRPGLAMVLAITLYTLQALWSRWWLARFKFGPAEWLWRSMTYGKWQTFILRHNSQSPHSQAASEPT